MLERSCMSSVIFGNYPFDALAKCPECHVCLTFVWLGDHYSLKDIRHFAMQFLKFGFNLRGFLNAPLVNLSVWGKNEGVDWPPAPWHKLRSLHDQEDRPTQRLGIGSR